MIDLVESDSVSTVGMIYTYNENMVDKYTYLCIYLPPEFTAQNIGPEAGYMFCNYLFKTYGFRKIYAEIVAYNTPSLKASLRNGFVKEGRLVEHRWFQEKFWDLYILALTFERFKKLPAPNHF